MTDTTADALRDGYLGRLDAAMRDVPHGIASDIRAGIREEFEGLDADATAVLIERLGDPAAIAAEARAGAPSEVFEAPVPLAAAPERQEATHTRGFAIVAALALGFGGIVVPVVGWLVGAVLVCLSPLWRTWEKGVAVAAPFVTVVATWILVHIIPRPDALGSGVGGSYGQASGEINPLVPAVYDTAWTASFVIMLVVVPASGLWLLWRLRGRHPVS